MNMPTKIALTCCLMLGLSACGGSSPSRSAPAGTGYAGGERTSPESVNAASERGAAYDSEDAYESNDVDGMDYGGAAEADELRQEGPPSQPEPMPMTAPSSPPSPPPSMQRPTRQRPYDHGGDVRMTIDVGPRFDHLLTLQGELGGVLALSTPDCPRARDLSVAICELSEHICTIADDNPDAEDARVRCRDGRSRCERAREQVSQGCGD